MHPNYSFYPLKHQDEVRQMPEYFSSYVKYRKHSARKGCKRPNITLGTSHPIPRWRLCVTLVNLNLGMVTGAMFVTNHYTAFMKSSVRENC